MEQFNNNDRHDHEDDSDILFVENPVSNGLPVSQARNVPDFFPQMASVLTDAQVLLGYQIDTDSSSLYNESDPISQMLRNMEKSVINEKDAEISVLNNVLVEKNKEIANFEEKITKLVDFITFVHGEFGKLLRSLTDMEIQDDSNILHLGPFKSETSKNEFVQNLNGLSTNFLSDYENLTGTKELFAKINMILRSRETVTSNQSANISNGNSHPVNSSVEQFNGSENCASSRTQAIPPLPSSNNIRPATFSCPPDIPSPVSSINNALSPAIFTEYPVLSIREVLAPNFTAPTPQLPSSSNMIVEPPSSPLNLTLRRPPSISRNSLQTEYGMNLATANKRHGIDHSKGSWGFFCLCNTRFNSSGMLKDHIKYFTMKNFECIICKKRYHKESLLKLHMISSHKIEYVGDDTVTCSICQGNFRKSKEFWEHLKNIHDIKISFKNANINPNNVSDNETKHVRDASVKPAYGCTCGKRYVHGSALSAHIKTKLPIKVFKCSWCTNNFQNHRSLKIHLSKVHRVEQDKKNKFGCTACGKGFPILADLRKHRTNVHRKVVKN